MLRDYYLWPSNHGSLIKWDKDKSPNKAIKLYIGECSHKTAWQIRIDTRNWSWYIVLRNNKVDWG